MVAGLAVLALGCDRCGSRSNPTPPPPKPGASAPAIPPATPAPLGWLRVTRDPAPLYEEPDDDDLLGFVTVGQLLEKRVSDDPESAGTPKMTIDLGGPDGPLHRDGELAPIRLSGDTEGWMFLTDLGPAPEGLPPSRGALCDAFSAGPKPALPRDACMGPGRFVLPELGPGTRRLVAWAMLSASASRLATLDLDALAAHQPAVRSALDADFIQSVRQVALPGGKALLMAQELAPAGPRAGIWIDLITVDAQGALTRGPQLPLAANEARGELIANQQLRLRVDRTPSGPAVRLEGTETVRVARTGEVKSRRDIRRAITWDAQGAVRVEDVHP